MSRSYCQRHQRPRPCPKCGRAGYGGAGRGQGRKPTLAQPVRVLVNLEQAELDAVLERFPGSSRSAALRQAIQRGLEPPSTPPAGESLARDVDGPLIADTAIKKRPSPPPATLRQFELSYEELDTMLPLGVRESDRQVFKEVSRKLYQQAFPDGKGYRAAPKGKRLEDRCTFRLSLSECRLLRRAIKGSILPSRGNEESLRHEYHQRRKKASESQQAAGRGGHLKNWVSEPEFLERRRRSILARNAELRPILAKIPWR